MTPPDQPLVTLPEALFIHTVMVRMFDTTGLGVRDHSAIEAALHRPLAGFGGQARYRTPFERAAAVWLALIKNHGFVDANKWTATAAMHRWLDREGFWLRAPFGEEVEIAVGIANDQHTVESLAAWIEEHAERHPLRLMDRPRPREVSR